jgi:hypothetical protein
MVSHAASSKFELSTATDSKNYNAIRALQENLHRQIMRESITFQFKAIGKAPIRLIIQDIAKVLLAVWTLNRIRAADIHVKKLANF